MGAVPAQPHEPTKPLAADVPVQGREGEGRQEEEEEHGGQQVVHEVAIRGHRGYSLRARYQPRYFWTLSLTG